MAEQSAVHSTFVMERSYAAERGRVFAAFADGGKKRRWLVEGEHHAVEAYEMEFRVGGWERARFRFGAGTPVAGMVCTSETVYLEIEGERRIVMASTMGLGGRRISAALVTVELTATAAGTEMVCTHQGAYFEGADGPEMREAGWRKLVERLAGEVAG